MAAVEVLEAAGFHVNVPMDDVCCGRPLYDWGMLKEAKALLRQILDTLKEPIEAGVPVVVLEASCATVFREELTNFFPDNEDAKRLSQQTFLLSDFLLEKAPDFQLPRLETKAILHGHCHHKSIFKMSAEETLLKKMGVDFSAPETGCCGMAGAFGFEREHFDISMKCGERALLPTVREMPKNALVITDGFSCRAQIAQTTERQALHLAEIIQLALNDGISKTGGDYPERAYLDQHKESSPGHDLRNGLLVGAGALALGGITFWLMKRKEQHEKERLNAA